MKRILGLSLALFAAALSFATPTTAKEVYLKSSHSGRLIGTSDGILAANAAAASQAVKLDMVSLAGNRVAFRVIADGSYVRAGVGAQTLLKGGSPHIRGWETFRVTRLPDGSFSLRSAQNGKLVRAGVGRNSLLAAVSSGAPQSWERFRIIPAAAVGQPNGNRAAVSRVVTGAWKVRRVAAHQTGHLTALAPRLYAASHVEIDRGGNLSATVGCNRMSARVSQDGAVWRSGPVMSTKMACPNGPTMAAERSLALATENAVRVAYDGNRLTLRNRTGNVVLVLVR